MNDCHLRAVSTTTSLIQGCIRREEKVGGSGFLYQKWPKSIFPSVNFLFPHHEIWVQWGGKGVQGGWGLPPSSYRCQPFIHPCPSPTVHHAGATIDTLAQDTLNANIGLRHFEHKQCKVCTNRAKCVGTGRGTAFCDMCIGWDIRGVDIIQRYGPCGHASGKWRIEQSGQNRKG